MGQLVLGIVGGAAGFVLSGGDPLGASIGFSLGMAAGSIAFPQKIDGPSIPPTLMQRSAYGQTLPIGFGCFRTAGSMIWEGGLSSSTSTSGGKGGPQITTTNWYATFAVAICDCSFTGPIGGIQRVWMNGILQYDVSASATPATATASAAFAQYMTVYLGTATQSPDPTMQAISGVASVPGYHYTAYVVFHGLPLQAFGNVIPIVNFEVVSAAPASLTQLFEVATMAGPTWAGTHYYNAPGSISPIIVGVSPSEITVIDRNYGATSFAAALGDGTVRYYNTTSGALITSGPASALPTWMQNWPMFANGWGPPSVNGTTDKGGFYATADGNFVYTNQHGGLSLTSNLSVQSGYPSCAYLFDLQALINALPGFSTDHIVGTAPCADASHLFVFMYSHNWVILNVLSGAEAVVSYGTMSADAIAAINTIPAGQTCPGSSYTGFGNVAAAGSVIGTGPTIFACLQSDLSTLWVVSAFADANGTSSGTNPAAFGQLAVLKIDNAGTMQVVAGMAVGFPNYQGTPCMPNTGGYWTSQPMTMWADSGVCAVISGQAMTAWQVTAAATASDLGTICSGLAQIAGVPSGNIDVSGVTGVPVWGCLIERQTTLRQIMNSIAPTYWFDMVESDTKLSFRRRSATPLATIPVADMLVSDKGKANAQPLTITRADDLALPQRVDVAYYNIGADYQIGGQYQTRQSTKSTQKASISAAAVMTDQQAINAASVILWDAWAGREAFDFATGPKWAAYEPTDIMQLADSAITYLVRLTSKKEAGASIQWQAVGCAPVYNPNVAPGIIIPSSQIVEAAGATTLLLLDLPPLRDQDGNTGVPMMYVVMYGASVNWPGGVLFKSLDGGITWIQQVENTVASGVGTTTSILTDYTGANMFDECSTVTVTLTSPAATLASATSDAVLNGANLCLIGNEILQYKNATLTGALSYRLSGFLRGRVDTEPFMVGHTLGEQFVMLTLPTGAPANLNIQAESVADIGAARDYEAITLNQPLTSGTPQILVSKGANLVCFYPCYCNAVKGPSSGDISLYWTRRNRISWHWLESVDVPMSEASESYVVTIYNGSAVVRTITVAGTGGSGASVVYTSAQQTTDFGSPQTTLKWGVAQISAITGAGNQSVQTQTPA